MFKKSLFTLALVFSFAISPIVSADTASDLQAQIDSIMARIQSLQAALNAQSNTAATPAVTTVIPVPNQSSGGGFCHTFTKYLVAGSRGQEVTALTSALTLEGFIDGKTDTFDDDIASAVIDFQTKYGIKKTGTVGPLTRAKLNALYGKCVNPDAKPTLNPGTLNKTIKIGESIQQVFVLEGNRWAEGIPYRWNFGKGAIPNGLSVELFGAFSGRLYGTPTETGNFSFAIEAYSEKLRTSAIAYVYLTVLPGDDTSISDVTATVTKTPTLELTYDSSNQEALLTATFDVSVTAGKSDLTLYTKMANASFFGQNNSSGYSNSLRLNVGVGAGEKTDAYGRDYTVVSAGKSVRLSVVLTGNPKQMFAGTYYAKLLNLNALGSNINNIISIPVSQAQTNTKTIIGEVSPYISAVPASIIPDSNGALKFTVTGVRFSGTNNTITIGQKEFPVFTSTNGGTTLELSLSGAGISAGGQSLFVTNMDLGRDAGKSNVVWVTIGTSPKDSITVLNPNGGETWTKGTTEVIRWQHRTPVAACKIDTNTGVTTCPKPTTYDLKLVPYYSSCDTRTNICPAYIPPYREPYTIKKGVSGYEYRWTVGGIEGLYDGLVSAGSYTIQVCQSGAGTPCDSSDSYFKIVSENTTGKPPVISGLDAPTTLAVGQTGTWRVKAYDPDGTSLSYSVAWGDESVAVSSSGGPRVSAATPFIQNSIFTHTYSTSGVYNPVFTVKDASGLSETTSATVSVGSSSRQPVTVLSPNGGESISTDSDFVISFTPAYGKRHYFSLVDENNRSRELLSAMGMSPIIGEARDKQSITITKSVFSVYNIVPGRYKIELCSQNPVTCDGSDSYFNITSGSTSSGSSITASLENTFEDRAGLWENFGSGPGHVNKTAADWNWTAVLKVQGSKSVQSISMTHNNGYEAWSTSRTNIYGKQPYPLVVVVRDNNNQLNKYYDQGFGFGEGIYTLKLYGQVETEKFSGARLDVSFTDGTSISADVPASNYTPNQTNAKPVIAGITGAQSSYASGGSIDLSVKGIESNGTSASSDKGYNVQAYVFPASDGSFSGNYLTPNPSYSYNGTYDPSSGYWKVRMNAPAAVGSYNLRISLYCSRENSSCWNVSGGRSDDTRSVVSFTVTSGTSQQPSVNLTSPVQPTSALIFQNAKNIQFTKLKLWAGSTSVLINGLVVEKTGNGSDNILSGVAVLDENGTRIGAAMLNSNHQANINFSLPISATASRTLTIVADAFCNLSQYAGSQIALAVVGVITPATVSGSLPISGALHTATATTLIQDPTTQPCGQSTQPSVTVLSPNGGERVAAGQLLDVAWRTANISSSQAIYIELLQGYKTVIPVLGGYINSGSTKIHIPETIVGDGYKIAVSYRGSGASVSDASDNTFSILSSTVAGYDACRLDYAIDGKNITRDAITDRSDCLARICDLYGPPNASKGVAGKCVFQGETIKTYPVPITSSITVTSPGAEESWYLGTTRTVVWKSSGVSKVSLWACGNTGVCSRFPNVPATGISNTGSYSIAVNQIPYSGTVKIRVASEDQYPTSTVYDDSDFFNVVSDVTVVSKPLACGTVGNLISTIGDVNFDGVISKADSDLIRSYVLGTANLTNTQQRVADVNLDKKVSTLDIALIAQYLDGQINTFSACNVAAPTVDLTVNGSVSPTVTVGAPVTITWSSQNASSCVGNGLSQLLSDGSTWGTGALPTSGSRSFTMPNISNVTVGIQCWENTLTPTVSADKVVGITLESVAVVPAPTVDLKVNSSDGPVSVASGALLTLSHTSTNATSCANNWDNNNSNLGLNSSGILYGPIAAEKTFIVTCSGSSAATSASASDSVTVNIQAASGGGGGGGSSISPTLSFVLDSSVEDRAGAWGNFKAGVGNGNKSPDDWNWTAKLSTPSSKTIKSIKMDHSNGYEHWSTDNSADYPLVVFENGAQLNYALGQTIIAEGTQTFRLFGQKEATNFAGSKLTITFTDGTSVFATIQSSGISVTAQTSQMANVLESVRMTLEGMKASLPRR